MCEGSGLLTGGVLQVWSTEAHDCKNGCICTKRVEPWGGEKLVVNPECPQRGHSSHVRSVAFSPEGKWIVSGSLDQRVKIWDAESGAEVSSSVGVC